VSTNREKGAEAVAVRYTDRQPTGVSFTLTTPHGQRAFTLPVNVGAVHQLLLAQERAGNFRPSRKKSGTFSSPEQAARVAWRTVKDWLEAQLAITEAQMATLDQVMLPYLHVEGEVTLYQRYREREQTAIEAGVEQ
jgi:hypothetical protein